jgi:hypothetical protein
VASACWCLAAWLSALAALFSVFLIFTSAALSCPGLTGRPPPGRPPCANTAAEDKSASPSTKIPFVFIFYFLSWLMKNDDLQTRTDNNGKGLIVDH